MLGIDRPDNSHFSRSSLMRVGIRIGLTKNKDVIQAQDCGERRHNRRLSDHLVPQRFAALLVSHKMIRTNLGPWSC